MRKGFRLREEYGKKVRGWRNYYVIGINTKKTLDNSQHFCSPAYHPSLSLFSTRIDLPAQHSYEATTTNKRIKWRVRC